MGDIQHLSELLSLNGRAFIDAAYMSILKRHADERGRDYYLGRLGAGVSKEEIVTALALSDEGAGMHFKLPGLKPLLRRSYRYSLFYWLSRALGVSRLERAINRLEFALFEQSQLLAAQLTQISEGNRDLVRDRVESAMHNVDPVTELFADAYQALADLQDAGQLMTELKRVVRSSNIARVF